MNHRNIHAESRAGKFVVHKTSDNVSGTAINGTVKASNGAVGLSENSAALRDRTGAISEVAI